MKRALLIIIFLVIGVSQALAIPPHKITPQERATFPWWSKTRPVRPSAEDKPWLSPDRVKRPPLPTENDWGEQCANNRDKQKTISHMRLAIKLDKMNAQND